MRRLFTAANDEVMKQACRDMQARSDNSGTWVPAGKIPDSLVAIGSGMKLPTNMVGWLAVVESYVRDWALQKLVDTFDQPDARACMKTISEVAGNEPGVRLTTRSSSADAERLGMMVCEMRSIANRYLRQTEPVADQPTSEISTNS